MFDYMHVLSRIMLIKGTLVICKCQCLSFTE